jgi:hypothetical protein
LLTNLFTARSEQHKIFDLLVKEKNVWGFGPHTANRKAITAGDRVLFYVTGVQVFAGAATLKSGAYKDVTGEIRSFFSIRRICGLI